jgi:hypothetical protein
MGVAFVFRLVANIRSGVLEQKEQEDLEASNVSLSFSLNVMINFLNEERRNNNPFLTPQHNKTNEAIFCDFCASQKKQKLFSIFSE